MPIQGKELHGVCGRKKDGLMLPYEGRAGKDKRRGWERWGWEQENKFNIYSH